MNACNRPSRRGSALIIVMVVMVAFALLITAQLQLGGHSQRETIRQLRASQAHWLSEAGVERALGWITASKNFRTSLSSIPQSYGPYTELDAGEYSLEIWAPDSETILIRSTGIATASGTAMALTNRTQLQISYLPGIPGAIVGLNDGHTELNDDVLVDSGNTFRKGTMEIDGMVEQPYVAYATEPPISGSGTFEDNYIPTPEPPTIDPALRFANLLSAAEAETNTAFSGVFSTNKTVYVNGDLTLVNGISGSGTLVVTGSLTFDGNKKTIDDEVEIVVKENIVIDRHTSVGDRVELFSQNGNISLQHNLDGGTVALIAPNGSIGHIQPDYDNSLGEIDDAHLLSSGHDVGDPTSGPAFYGIFYAGYDIILRHKADIRGTLIAERDMQLGHSSNPGSMKVRYDKSVFENDWQINFGNEIVITESVWSQLNPL